jgi:hypothetical protein
VKLSTVTVDTVYFRISSKVPSWRSSNPHLDTWDPRYQIAASEGGTVKKMFVFEVQIFDSPSVKYIDTYLHFDIIVSAVCNLSNL